MQIVSLFSGAGGLDLGFHQAGFQTIYANEYDKTIWETFEHNFPNTKLDKRSITDVPATDIPECIGIIGGPPCQSWSEAGSGRGIEDKRGLLFYEYIRILKKKKPLFFLAENVSGILLPRHKEAFQEILTQFKKLGYNVTYELFNTHDYNVPQDRKRVIIVGYNEKMKKQFKAPVKSVQRPVLKDAIGDLKGAKPGLEKNYANTNENLYSENHEYMHGGFSTIYMSRNRVRSYDEPSFTIQAGGRHAPIHPQAPKMQFIEQNKRIFVPGKEDLYRRLSIRECARIQTFPDDYLFKYNRLADGYKMVGNAVPVEFARRLGKVIYKDISEYILFNQTEKSQLKMTKNQPPNKAVKTAKEISLIA